jgi:hypothetical protein
LNLAQTEFRKLPVRSASWTDSSCGKLGLFVAIGNQQSKI